MAPTRGKIHKKSMDYCERQQIKSLSYSDAGVNLSTWNSTREIIGRLVEKTYNANVVGRFGQFGGMFSASFLKDYRKPVLVSSVDGVGTKIKIAVQMNKHDTVGEDIVNHCINDILVLGARPLFFLDYIGIGKLVPEIVESILKGLTRACHAAGCVLIGGETAEMPDVYSDGEYDLAGTIIGVVEEDAIIDGASITPGDVIIGLRSNGLHTNGYSLARKIVLEVAQKKYTDLFEATGRSIGEELLRPHRAYSSILSLMNKGLIKGCAHITGGGFPDNVDRILPPSCDALIDTRKWEPDAIFRWLAKQGNVSPQNMYHTFNMGIGLVIVASSSAVSQLCSAAEISNFEPVEIGVITEGSGKVKMEF